MESQSQVNLFTFNQETHRVWVFRLDPAVGLEPSPGNTHFGRMLRNQMESENLISVPDGRREGGRSQLRLLTLLCSQPALMP